MLEGRINLFHAGTVTGRVLYILIANFLIGVVFSIFLLRTFLKSGVLTPKRVGLQSSNWTAITVLAAGFIGFILFLIQSPPDTDPIVTLNVFAQVLPVSIAEVVVCWVLVGSTFESIGKPAGKWGALVIAIIAADVLFGVYHYAHSAPYDETRMVLFLMLPGLGTSLIYFLSRSLYGAVMFHNFMALIGILQNIDQSTLKEPAYELYFMALISLILLISLDVGALRRQGAKARKGNTQINNGS
jgi:hypothetical protein